MILEFPKDEYHCRWKLWKQNIEHKWMHGGGKVHMSGKHFLELNHETYK